MRIYMYVHVSVRVCIGVHQHTLHHVPPDEFLHCSAMHQTRQAVKDHCLTQTVGSKAAEQATSI